MIPLSPATEPDYPAATLPLVRHLADHGKGTRIPPDLTPGMWRARDAGLIHYADGRWVPTERGMRALGEAGV